MATVASGLELQKLALSPNTAQTLLDKCRVLPSARSRPLQNSSIRLQGCLINLLNLETFSTNTPVNLIRDLVADIVNASHDELHFPTRMAAAQAVRSCVERILCIRERLDTDEATSVCLQLLLVLYDELNDDDEEIREIAQEATLKALQATDAAYSSIRLCSLASREALLDLVIKLYGESKMLIQIAVARITDSRNEMISNGNLFSDTIETKLRGIIQNMNDLFSEERQNLYVDELDEIRCWSEVLRKCSKKTISWDLWQQSARWCFAGINVLRVGIPARFGEHSYTKSMPKLTRHFDVLELCIRVVQLIQFLLNTELPTEDAAEGWRATQLRNQVTRELHDWRNELQGGGGHPSLIATISDKA